MSQYMEPPSVIPLSDRRRFTLHRGGGAGGAPPGHESGDGHGSPASSRIGVWLLLTSATIIFASLISAYLVRMDLADWSSVPKPGMLWANTVLLVLASVAWQASVNSARRSDADALLRRLQLAGALILLFVAGQLLAWQQMRVLGFPLGSGPASSFFYLITMIHGLHILGGLIAWVSALIRFKSAPTVNTVKSQVELSAVYWHFLLVVWLVMFGLMLAT